ncbi:MAG TPA: nitronate monooxygenase family protein [bacterium]|nr:nitronate monooxygenase family protein [bacterium]
MTADRTLPDLVIGDLVINPPIIQGGMGVRVSASRLVSAVSKEGALGVIATVGLGEELLDMTPDYPRRAELGLREQIQNTKKHTHNPFGVNVMCALTNYDNLVQVSVAEGVAAIISGAGLPMKLPGLVSDRHVKLIPIVSSARAAGLICKTWQKRFSRLPDALVVEGPLAGGHLGFSHDQILDVEAFRLERLVTEVLEVAREHGNIPVIPAGGIYDGRDIAKFLRMGASGVQMATRFVCTHECDAADAYKQAFLDCRKEDITVIHSPVGMPARVIKNDFVERYLKGEKVNFGCPYHCLLTCEPAVAGYCIAQALLASYRGQMDNGYAMCGANAWRCNKIVSVHELIEELVEECAAALHGQPSS